MRDIRKDKEYFDKYLDYQYSRIAKKAAKLKISDEDKKQRVLVSLTGYELDLIKAEFSAGATKENIKTLMNRAIKLVSEYTNITYEDLLNLISLSIMVNDNSEAAKIIKMHNEKIKNDRLLNYLSMYINGEIPVWDINIPLKNEFRALDDVMNAEAREDKLCDYLNSWYENHSGYSWYNSHLGSEDTYCGYWSFESAAIAFILGLNESKLKTSEYYPSFDGD